MGNSCSMLTQNETAKIPACMLLRLSNLERLDLSKNKLDT